MGKENAISQLKRRLAPLHDDAFELMISKQKTAEEALKILFLEITVKKNQPTFQKPLKKTQLFQTIDHIVAKPKISKK